MPRAIIPDRFIAPRQLQMAARITREVLGATDGALTVDDLQSIDGTITIIDNGDGTAGLASVAMTRAQQAFLP